MDKRLAEHAELTEQIAHRIPDVSYEELVDFVDRREELKNEIERELANGERLRDAEQRELKALLTHDARILEHMEFLREEAGDWLRRYNQAKVQRQAYGGSSQAEGFLFDRKK